MRVVEYNVMHNVSTGWCFGQIDFCQSFKNLATSHLLQEFSGALHYITTSLKCFLRFSSQLFLSDPGIPDQIYGSSCLKLTHKPFLQHFQTAFFQTKFFQTKFFQIVFFQIKVAQYFSSSYNN